MPWNAMIDRFAKEAPVATMVRGLMANILSASQLNAIFHDKAERQWENELLFSTVVDLLSLVVTKSKRSLHAAYQTHREELGVSAKALYDKVAGVELSVTQELVLRTSQRMQEVLAALDPERPSLLPGYEVVFSMAATWQPQSIASERRARCGALRCPVTRWWCSIPVGGWSSTSFLARTVTLRNGACCRNWWRRSRPVRCGLPTVISAPCCGCTKWP
jgi:hypothetical protein